MLMSASSRRFPKAVGRGTSYGAPTEAETQLAADHHQRAAFAANGAIRHSGTEATMSAIRLARAATNRDLIVKCIGLLCYHGHFRWIVVEAAAGALTLGTPSSPGIPKSIAGNTVLVPYNNLAPLRKFSQNIRRSWPRFSSSPSREHGRRSAGSGLSSRPAKAM